MALDTNLGWALGPIPGLLGKKSTRESIGHSLFGRGSRTEQIPRFNPEQQQAFSQILQQALSGMQDPSKGFEPMAQQARSQFQTQTLPSIAERFTAMGQGGQRSSDFAGALGQAGAGLEEGLASQQAQYGLQRGGQLQQLLGMGLQPQFESLYRPETHGMLGGAMQQALPALIQMLMGGI